MFSVITSELAAHFDATDNSSTEWLYSLFWTCHTLPRGSKMSDNHTSSHVSVNHQDKRTSQLKPDTDKIRPFDPAGLAAGRSEVIELQQKKDSTPATVALLARVSELPAELQKMIYDEVIQLPTGTRIQVDKHFRLPSVLHVNSAIREALFSKYVTTNRFHFAKPDLLWTWVYDCVGTRGEYNIRIRPHNGILHANVYERSTWLVVVCH